MGLSARGAAPAAGEVRSCARPRRCSRRSGVSRGCSATRCSSSSSTLALKPTPPTRRRCRSSSAILLLRRHCWKVSLHCRPTAQRQGEASGCSGRKTSDSPSCSLECHRQVVEPSTKLRRWYHPRASHSALGTAAPRCSSAAPPHPAAADQRHETHRHAPARLTVSDPILKPPNP